MSVTDAVQKGADAFKYAEDRAKTIKSKFRGLRKVFEAVRDEGRIGALECQALASEADVLATQFEADLYALHARLTKRCQELEIDLPALGDGEVTTMGGTGR